MKFTIFLAMTITLTAIWGYVIYEDHARVQRSYNTWYQKELRPRIEIDIQRIEILGGDAQKMHTKCSKDWVVDADVDECLSELNLQLLKAEAWTKVKGDH